MILLYAQSTGFSASHIYLQREYDMECGHYIYRVLHSNSIDAHTASTERTLKKSAQFSLQHQSFHTHLSAIKVLLGLETVPTMKVFICALL